MNVIENKLQFNKFYIGDCTKKLKLIETNSVDLIYFDPPFFTQKNHKLTNKDGLKKYEFSDIYSSLDEYLGMIRVVLMESQRVLKDTGSIFLHCDKTASHHLRILLDEIFNTNNFRSEIIWYYKRWSNSKKGLLNSHQTILFYSKSENFKFNTQYTDYSSTTNVDQILQDRVKDINGKSKYKVDADGKTVIGKEKKGVPLSDVWEIPYLNPKAKERNGYPTQKPIILLQRIIKIVTDENDVVVDPFCGSGTTCIAAQSLKRRFIGIDKSEDAIELSNSRLISPIITESNLLKIGRDNYYEKSEKELAILKILDAIPVQRNSGIDGFLKEYYNDSPVPIKIQKDTETLLEALLKLEKASKSKEFKKRLLIQTKKENILDYKNYSVSGLTIIKSPSLYI